jgi:ribosomal protein L32
MTCALRNYSSKAEAKRALKRIQAKVPGATASRIFRCPDCGMWHLAKRLNPAREAPGPPPTDTGQRP